MDKFIDRYKQILSWDKQHFLGEEFREIMSLSHKKVFKPASIETSNKVFFTKFIYCSAAINRNVSVKLLVSDRANSRPYMKRLLQSLLTLNGLKQIVKIEIKLFAVSFTIVVGF